MHALKADTAKRIEDLKKDTVSKLRGQMEDNIEQINHSIQENSRFSALESERVASRFKQIENQLKSIREHEIQDIFTMRQLDIQKEFVGQELFKQQIGTLNKRISSLEFDSQAIDSSRKDADQLNAKMIKEKLTKEINSLYVAKI